MGEGWGGGVPGTIIRVMANEFARDLRKNLTNAERRLWWRLRRRQLGYHFRRQEPIGPYIADFVCFDPKLIIECDGGQHVENAQDALRDAWFARQDFAVLRFWNHDVLRETDVVVEQIFDALRVRAPLPNPPPRGGRG